MNDNTKFHIVKEPWGNSMAVYITRLEGAKYEPYLLVNNKWVKIKEGANYDPSKATLRLPTFLWQKFVDSLTKEIKPTLQAELDAELKATKYHLEDMRKLAMKGIK